MRITLTLDIEARAADGWEAPADVQEVSNALLGELDGLDYEEGPVSFYVKSCKVTSSEA